MTIARRGFLTGLGLGTLATGTAWAGGGANRLPGYSHRMGLLHDSTLCVGCRSCEAACCEANALPPPEPDLSDVTVFDERRGISQTAYTVVNRYRSASESHPAVYRKHQCMHCNEPCCASVCFVRAFTKTPEGPVLYNADLCAGCRYCVFACPYYALAYEYEVPATPRVVRCTMCYPRIVRGQSPLCAERCPTGAIQYGEREQLIEVARDRIRQHPHQYINHIFGEHEFAGTSWLTLVGIPLREVGLHENVSHLPLPDLTTSFLSLAPLVAAIFPGMLAGFYAFTKRKERLREEAFRRVQAEAKARADLEMEERIADLLDQAERDKAREVERAIRSARREAFAEVAATGEAKARPKEAPKKKAPAAPPEEAQQKAAPAPAKEPTKKPAAAPKKDAEHKAAPAPATKPTKKPTAAPKKDAEHKAAPAPAKEKEPTKKPTAAPKKDAEHKAAPAPAKEKEPTKVPTAAPKKDAEHKAAPAPAKEPTKKPTASPEKDAKDEKGLGDRTGKTDAGTKEDAE